MVSTMRDRRSAYQGEMAFKLLKLLSFMEMTCRQSRNRRETTQAQSRFARAIDKAVPAWKSAGIVVGGRRGQDLPSMKADEPDPELGAIAHDLSNVLAAIRGFATVIREDMHDDAVVRADADHILTAVEQGLELVKRIGELRGERTR
jgi:hypothetical protein